MKRRAFICGGMAAILASRRAPAFCVAMRNGMMRPSAPPTPPMPYDAEVEYLESTGAQYIDTGVYARDGLLVYAKICFFRPDDNTAQSVFGAGGLFARIVFAYRYDTDQVIAGMNTASPGLSGVTASELEGNETFVIIDTTSDNKYTSVNNAILYTSNTHSAQVSAKPILIFNSYLANTIQAGAPCKIYSFSIKDTSTNKLLIDLIPVRFTNSNNQSEGVMFDRVSAQLLGNAGTGAFTIGPDKS